MSLNKTMAVNKYKEKYDVYIGRGSKWGNPFAMANNSDEERNRVCDAHEEWLLRGDGQHLLNDIHELSGKKLGCFCSPKRCHGDILSKLANGKVEL